MRVIRGLVVFALLFSIAAGLAACGGGGGEGGGETTDISAASPQEVAESANFEGVHTAEIEIELEIDRYKPHEPEEINMRILGNVVGLGEGRLPKFDFAIESKGPLSGRDVEFSGGLLYTGEYAVANFEQQTYEPSRGLLEGIESGFEEAQQAGDEGNVMACVEAAQGIPLSQLVHGLKKEGRAEYFDGTPVYYVGGTLNIPGLIDGLVQLEEDSACAAQLKAAGVPSVTELDAAKAALGGKIKEAPMQLAVDKHGLVRNLNAEALGTNAQGEEVEVEFLIRVLKVNEPTELATASGSAPFAHLLKELGLDEAALAQANGAELWTGFLEGVGKLLTGRDGQ
jgi:hypothetical protein